MNIRLITSVYFSPTGTTRRITESIVSGMQGEEVTVLDCTGRSRRAGIFRTFHDEVVILAAPVYYGRVQQTAAKCFSALTADKTPAVLVVVYGNRAYDDALLELHDIAASRGFTPVAGAAFIGEHSFSSEALPIAPGRPDEEDLGKAREFGAAVRKKLQYLEFLDAMEPLIVSGHRPYVEPEVLYRIGELRKGGASFTPGTDESLCTRCNRCIEVCPQDAIDRVDMTKTDKWQCVLCLACVKVCPTGARRLTEPMLLGRIRELCESCQRRKEPEYYL